MATHSSVLAWRIPGLGEPGGLPSMGSHRVGHDWSDLAAAATGVLRGPQGTPAFQKYTPWPPLCDCSLIISWESGSITPNTTVTSLPVDSLEGGGNVARWPSRLSLQWPPQLCPCGTAPRPPALGDWDLSTSRARRCEGRKPNAGCGSAGLTVRGATHVLAPRSMANGSWRNNSVCRSLIYSTHGSNPARYCHPFDGIHNWVLKRPSTIV